MGCMSSKNGEVQESATVPIKNVPIAA